MPEAPPAAEVRAIPVTVAAAGTGDLEIWESSVGQLEARVAPLIGAEVAGRLTVVDVDVGDPVAQGQRLAEIDAVDFGLARDMAQADIERLQALIHAQHLNVERYRAQLNFRHRLVRVDGEARRAWFDVTDAEGAVRQAECRIDGPGGDDHAVYNEGHVVRVGDHRAARQRTRDTERA